MRPRPAWPFAKPEPSHPFLMPCSLTATRSSRPIGGCGGLLRGKGSWPRSNLASPYVHRGSSVLAICFLFHFNYAVPALRVGVTHLTHACADSNARHDP